jgi:hypothetical protein
MLRVKDFEPRFAKRGGKLGAKRFRTNPSQRAASGGDLRD